MRRTKVAKLRHPLARLSLRATRSSLPQILMTAMAVVVGTAFLTAVLSLHSSLVQVFRSGVSADVVHDLYVLGPENAALGQYEAVTTGVAQSVEGTPGVEAATLLWHATGALLDGQGQPIDTHGAPVIYGPTLSGSRGPQWIVGRPPSTSSEIGLEESGARLAGLEVGDRAQVMLGAQRLPVTVSGIYAFDVGVAGMVTVALDPGSTDALAEEAGTVPAIGANVETGLSADQVVPRVKQALGENGTVLTNGQYASHLEKEIASTLGYLAALLLVFVAVALFVSTFVISNTLQMTVRSSAKEYALLRTLGASRSQIVYMVLSQGAFVGVVGGLLGAAAGAGLVALASYILTRMGSPIEGGIPVTAQTVVAAVTVGLLVTTVSALVPAHMASKLSPVGALVTVESEEPRSLKGRTIFGVAMAALGLAATTLGALRSVPYHAVLLGLGALILTVGLLILSPALIRVFARWVGRTERTKTGLHVRLAARALAQHPRRTGRTAGALIVGIALVSGGATLLHSVQSSTSGLIEEQVATELLAQPNNPFVALPEGTLDALEEVSGVVSVADQVATGTARVETADGPINVAATTVAPGYLDRFVMLPLIEGTPDALERGEVYVTRSFASTHGLSVSDSLEITVGSETRSVDIGGITDSVFTRADIVAGPDTILDSASKREPALAFIELEEGANPKVVTAALEEASANLATVSIIERSDLAGPEGEVAGQLILILYVLLSLSAIVAVIGIVNTEMLSVSERYYEFGLLRALGLDQKGLAATVRVEALIISIYGTLMGLALGVSLAAALQGYLQSVGLVRLFIPWAEVGVIAAAGLLAGVVAAGPPARKAAKTPILTLVDENRI